MSNQSEREETLVEQLQLRDQRILELEKMIEESMMVMDELVTAGELMVAAWNAQQKRLVVLEAAVRGPHFPTLPKDAK